LKLLLKVIKKCLILNPDERISAAKILNEIGPEYLALPESKNPSKNREDNNNEKIHINNITEPIDLTLTPDDLTESCENSEMVETLPMSP
jgi:serine/threonine protein kinase